MKSYTEKLLENLQNHIPNFKKELITKYLKEAEIKFEAKLQYSYCSDEKTKGLILQYNNYKHHIGAVFCGETREDMEINMFHHFINWHYVRINDNKLIANLDYENNYKQPIFG